MEEERRTDSSTLPSALSSASRSSFCWISLRRESRVMGLDESEEMPLGMEEGMEGVWMSPWSIAVVVVAGD